LLDLGPSGLSLASEISKHSFSYNLSFVDHISAPESAILGDLLGLSPGLVQRRLTLGDGVGRHRLGFSLGPLGPFGGRVVGRFENLRCFESERFGDLTWFELFDIDLFGLSQTIPQLLVLRKQPPNLICGPLQFSLNRHRIKSAPDQLEVGLFDGGRIDTAGLRIARVVMAVENHEP